ncbi:hypothetical protein NIES4103_53600 [Nostoc sp. NIES-4103]|nr:hypothetical protein NIES4103_53600 [Nostoc sp. NIES-4103]
MNKLNVMVKIYENFFIKSNLATPTVAYSKLTLTKNLLKCQAVFQAKRVTKTNIL